MKPNPPPKTQDPVFDTWMYHAWSFITTSVTATLNFPNILANTNADMTVQLPGVKSGDTIIATPPSTIEAGLTWCAFVSANDTVTIRLHCYGTGAIDPASAEWRITAFKY